MMRERAILFQREASACHHMVALCMARKQHDAAIYWQIAANQAAHAATLCMERYFDDRSHSHRLTSTDQATG